VLNWEAVLADIMVTLGCFLGETKLRKNFGRDLKHFSSIERDHRLKWKGILHSELANVATYLLKTERHLQHGCTHFSKNLGATLKLEASVKVT